MRSLDESPIPSEPGRPDVNLAVFRQAFVQAMYLRELVARLSEALADAQNGDGEGLLALYDAYYQRSEDGTWGNELEAFQSISCMDQSERPTVEQSDADALLINEAAPRVSPNTTGDYFCTFYPESIDPRVEITGAGAGPIVVIGTTGDPATPLESTRAMAAAAGGRAPDHRDRRPAHRLRRQRLRLRRSSTTTSSTSKFRRPRASADPALHIRSVRRNRAERTDCYGQLAHSGRGQGGEVASGVLVVPPLFIHHDVQAAEHRVLSGRWVAVGVVAEARLEQRRLVDGCEEVAESRAMRPARTSRTSAKDGAACVVEAELGSVRGEERRHEAEGVIRDRPARARCG